jgi:prevent-host-death family protein
LELSYLW